VPQPEPVPVPQPEPDPVPPPALDGAVDGQGHVNDASRRHVFALSVSRSGNSQTGRLEYSIAVERQRSEPSRFAATSFTQVRFSDDATVSFAGSGTWNGRAGYSFEGQAVDRGNGGGSRDGLSLVVRDPSGAVVATVNGALDGGDIRSMPKSGKGRR
jgi:hypothetical protein